MRTTFLAYKGYEPVACLLDGVSIDCLAGSVGGRLTLVFLNGLIVVWQSSGRVLWRSPKQFEGDLNR